MTRSLLCLFIFLSCFLQSASGRSESNVLVLHSYNPERIWTGWVKDGIEEVFSEVSDTQVFHEFLDANRFPETKHSEVFWTYLLTKYRDLKPDVIMISDDAALRVFQSLRGDTFASTPVVYMGINQVSQSLIDTPNYTGVFENRDIVATIFDIKTITNKERVEDATNAPISSPRYGSRAH